jgi:RHS repeat-associated protein
MKQSCSGIIRILPASLLLAFSSHLSAINPDPYPYEPDYPSSCPDCGDEEESDPACTPENAAQNSVDLTFNLGGSPYERPTNYSAAYTAGITFGKPGSRIKNFKDVVKYFEGSEKSNLWNSTLNIETDMITAETFKPSNLRYKQNHKMEIGKTAATGNAVRQVLTHDFLVDIQQLPAGQEGFEIRWYFAADKGAEISDGIYALPPGDPVKYVKVSNPTPETYNTADVHSLMQTAGATQRRIHYRYVSGINTTTGRFEQRMETWTDVPSTGTQIEVETMEYLSGLPTSSTQDYIRTLKRVDLSADGQYGTTWTVISRTREKYFELIDINKDSTSTEKDPHGKMLLKEKIQLSRLDSDTEGLKTTYGYYADPINPLLNGHPKWQKNPDGSWIVWIVNATSSSQTVKEIKPFGNSGTFVLSENGSNADNVDELQAWVTQETITSNERTTLRKALGQTIGQVSTKFLTGSNGERIVRTREYYNADSYFETYKAYYAFGNGTSVSAGRIAWETHRDGTATTYTFSNEGGGHIKVTRRNGAATGVGDAAAPVITAGTETQTTYNGFWKAYAETTSDIEGFITSFWVGTNIDLYGRPEKIEYNGISNDYSTSVETCCGLASRRDRNGTVTTYSHDLLKREYRRIMKRSSTGVAIQTSTARTGLTTTTSVSAGSGDASISFVTSKTVRNLLGETIESWAADADGDGDLEKTTILTEYPATGGSMVTETNPLLGTRITETYRDGRTKRVHGTAVANMSYAYGVHSLRGGGLTAKVIRETSAGGTSEWTETYTDHLDRTIKTAHPDGAADDLTYYDATAAGGKRGQLASMKDPDEVANAGKGTSVSYDYNSEGERSATYEAIADGHTRATITSRSVVKFTAGAGNTPPIPDDTYFMEETKVNNVVVQTTYTSSDGYDTHIASLSGLSSNIRSVPNDGAWTVTSVSPSGQSRKETHTAGFLEKTEFFDNATSPVRISFTSYTPDALGRIKTATDSRTGTTTYSGVTDTGYTPSGNLLGMKEPGPRLTTYQYDALGQRLATTLPDTTVIQTRYNATGEIQAEWGAQTYPTYRTFDEQGRPATLHTWRDSGSLDLSDGVSAAELAASSTTAWLYDPLRGWLVEKNHHGETDNGTTDRDNTYTLAGRLLTRTSERGFTATHAYDRGMLESIIYTNDPTETPNVSRTYDSFGRPLTLSNGIASSTYTYAADLGPDKETITYALPGLATFTRVLDRRARSFGRDAGWELNQTDTNGDTVATDHAVTYGYSATTGRFETIANSAGTFTYGYLPDSNLLKTVTKAASGGNPAFVTTRAYDNSRDTLDSIENKAGTLVRSTYDYTAVNGGVNSIGQRMGVRTAFDLGGAHIHNSGDTSWGYDNLSQVTAANLPGEDLDVTYTFDSIGNRFTAAKGNFAEPGVNSAFTADILTEYFGSASNATPPVLTSPGASSLNQYAAIKTPSATVLPVHDFDGNMTHGPLPVSPGANCTLVWDAESRLIEVKNASNVSLVKYTYDALSRRISRSVGVSPTSSTLYLYDGFNCIAEWSADLQSASLTITRTWGIDLSATLQGAGGVGGLVAEKQGANTFYPTYDGNGNISEYLEADGDVAAHYEYDPFGNIVKESYASGFNASSFTYQFSTKPLDATTGLYYYLYRWYDPVTGRWMSRDPIAERGGVNLYGFVGNDAIRRVDLLGLAPPGKGCPKPNKKPRPPKEKGGATAPPKPPGHKGFHHYGNWGGPGWANGGWNYEDGMLPPFDESAPHTDERDLCYKHHDYDIAKCETGEDCPCPEDKKKVSDCIEEADKKLADCLRDAGVKGLEPWAFDTIIPWLVH